MSIVQPPLSTGLADGLLYKEIESDKIFFHSKDGSRSVTSGVSGNSSKCIYTFFVADL